MPEIIASTYEIIGKIGSGGGGNVYLANHLRLGKRVILKADKRTLSARPELLRREVDVLKNLSHSYIPQVYDFFVEDETVYTVMDFIDGESLDRPLRRGERFSQPQVIRWAIQLLEALSYLHSPTHGDPPRGFVHSDIKPANLMRTATGDICLIDFNIALALGEDNVIGCSAGYASPEHYGLDYSSGISGTASAGDGTIAIDDNTATLLMGGSTGPSASSGRRIVRPDVRSDIYSTGATLYHLLSGKRPASSAMEVEPLSEQEFSPQVVHIITKAMNPNPDLRYQTAEEMLSALMHLRENDPRMVRLMRQRHIACVVLAIVAVLGIGTTFVGLSRMRTAESWLKLAEYSKNALEKGDHDAAVAYALQAIPEKSGFLTPERLAQPQRALADALGVYDLSDGYKASGTITLPSEPLYMELAPDGETVACIYAYEVAVIDTDTAEIIASYPVEKSALSEVHYLDSNTIIFAGEGGIQTYDIAKDDILWSGEPATLIRISGDGRRVAAVCRDENRAVVYNARNGEVLSEVDFGEKHQYVVENDSFVNPEDNLLALNANGSMMGISFSDGSAALYDVDSGDRIKDILTGDSDYSHFEGGFYKKYFAFSASNPSNGIFAVIDTDTMEQTGGYESEYSFGVQTDDKGIYVQTENILTKLHPVTGEQTPLVTTSETIRHFAHSDEHTLIAVKDGFRFFDSHAKQISSYTQKYSTDFVQIASGTALVGSLDTPVVRILKYESHPDAEIFAYDPEYGHDEARISGDGSTVMLFSYDRFRLYDMEGELLAEEEIPDAGQVYDQQYIRDEDGSRLEVIYNDGHVRIYDASDGGLASEEDREKPDRTMYEEFFTDKYRIESPLHESPTVYRIDSGERVCELEKDAFLTYVTEAGDYIITQYVTAEGEQYGLLLNDRCETLAYLPRLCDIIGERLFFDYSTGDVRETHIYEIDELMKLAQGSKKGE